MTLRKTKALSLLSLIVATTVLGALVLSVSASEDVLNEETELKHRGFRSPPWLDTLTDEQRDTLTEMIEEHHTEIENQLEDWNTEMSELTYEQRETLKTMMEENRAEVKAQLEEWGIEIPMQHGPMGGYENLTEEQREELKTMKQEYRDSVKAKLEEWGIEAPELDDNMGFHKRGPRCFGLFKP